MEGGREVSREEEASADVLVLTDEVREKGRGGPRCAAASELRSDSMDGAGVRFWATGGVCWAAAGSAGKKVICVEGGVAFVHRKDRQKKARRCYNRIPLPQDIVKGVPKCTLHNRSASSSQSCRTVTVDYSC